MVPPQPLQTLQQLTTKVLEPIDCKSTLTSKIEEVKNDVSLIRQDLQKLREHVTETRTDSWEDDLLPLHVTTERLQHQLHAVLSKQDNMENRLRRCNLRLVGLPEGVEGSDPRSFLENLLISTFGRPAFSASFAVKRSSVAKGLQTQHRCILYLGAIFKANLKKPCLLQTLEESSATTLLGYGFSHHLLHHYCVR